MFHKIFLVITYGDMYHDGSVHPAALIIRKYRPVILVPPHFHQMGMAVWIVERVPLYFSLQPGMVHHNVITILIHGKGIVPWPVDSFRLICP